MVEELDAILASTQAVYDRLHDGERITITVAPCSPFSVTTELMSESAALARQLGVRLHTHLAETLDEEESCLARFGKRPLEVLDDIGWIALMSGSRTASISTTQKWSGSPRPAPGSPTARRATAGWDRASLGSST